MKCLILRRRTLTVLACALLAAAMFALVNAPAVAEASATDRQLPIYCVQRDQKMLAISFDAAWGNEDTQQLIDILGKYNNREGIVIDTRFNGGGRLHEDIEILFSGQKYFTQVVRGRETCDMPSRRWNKPSIMVMCEANYSNAHGTPWVYSHRGLGKLVGMPVPGTMTSVSWERLQDPSLVFGIPVVGYRLSDGSYLENSQLEPDIKVANSPETIVKGEDTQLKAAVEELLKELEK